MSDVSRRGFLKYLGPGVAGVTAMCLDSSLRTDENPIGSSRFTVAESFFTPKRGNNLDTPAVWHGRKRHLLVVTAKESDELVVFDATDGSYVTSIGSEGSNRGEFRRPNGICIIDDLALVVERDNDRVQVLRMPDGSSLGTFGENRLQRPYGCSAYKGPSGYEVYVTDDYDAPRRESLGRRVKQYRITVSRGGLLARHVRTFGATSDPGALYKVESIYADPCHDHLMIADEENSVIKLYDLRGNFSRVAADVFDNNDPEGIALYRRRNGSGLWLFTEQNRRSEFHLFGRISNDHVATFTGKKTSNTDGVCLIRQAVGPFSAGVLYAVHDDERVAAFDWKQIMSEL